MCTAETYWQPLESAPGLRQASTCLLEVSRSDCQVLTQTRSCVQKPEVTSRGLCSVAHEGYSQMDKPVDTGPVDMDGPMYLT